MHMRRVSVVIVTAITFASWVPAAEQSQTDEQFKNRPGWSWVVEPFRWEGDTQTDGGQSVVMLVEEGKQQELIVVFAMPFQGLDGFHSFEPIAFDEHGTRHKLQARVAQRRTPEQGAEGTILYRWGSPSESLPANQVKYVGLEGLTIEGWKIKVQKSATKARKEAKEKGLYVLPFPVVGQPYPFDLTDMNGKAIESNQLEGKVVVLDFWATWCFPCVQKMPKLKQLYEQWHDKGLEVVGINFDREEQTCLEAIEHFGIPWRNSIAPMDQELRTIWMDAIGVKTLPRILILDREGRLSADCDPDELEEHLTTLMKATRKAND